MSQIDWSDSDYGEEFSIRYTVEIDGRYFTPSYSFESVDEAVRAYRDHVSAIEESFEDVRTMLMDFEDIENSGPAGGNILI